MRKLLVLCLILSALGAGCSAENEAKPAEGTVQKEESVKKTNNHTMKEPQKPQGDAPWMDAYFEIVKGQADEAVDLKLFDIDFDGIPELFLTHRPSSSGRSRIDAGYSYKDGTITDIRIPEEAVWSQLRLYEKKENGELVWLAEGNSDLGQKQYYSSMEEVDFSDFSNVKRTVLLEWTEDRNGDSTSKVKYTMMPDQTVVTKQQIDEAKKQLLSQYKTRRVFILSAVIDDLMVYNSGQGTPELGKELFDPLARLYDETVWENSRKDSRFVYSTRLTDSAGYDHPEGLPVSIIWVSSSKPYEGNLSLYQILMLPDASIQKSINEKLYTLARNDLAAYKGKKGLHVSQDAYIYHTYLSVCQTTQYTDEDTGEKKEACSAATFNLGTGEEAKLSDLAAFDDHLKDKIYAGEFKNSRFTHEECLELGIYDKLWSLVSNPDLKNQFYVDRFAVGFIIEAAPGDSLCFEIAPGEPKDFTNE